MSPRVSIVTEDADEGLAIAKSFDTAPAEWLVELCGDLPETADVVVLGPTSNGLRDRAAKVAPVVAWTAGADTQLLHDIAALLTPRPRIYAVTSACGGAGATSVATHLAARWGRRCLLVEVARHEGPSPLALRLDLPDPRELGDPPPHLQYAGSFSFTSVASPEEFAEGVPRWSGDYDRFLADCPLETVAGEPLGWRAVVCVMPPTISGAHRARWLLDRMADGACALVVNRTGRGGETTMATLTEITRCKVCLELPVTPRLRDVEETGRLLGPWSRWASGIARLHHGLDHT